MWRVLNMFLIVLIGLTVYKTYDIKHDVMALQNDVRDIKREIVTENANIGMYQAEWATLTSAFNLNRLKQKLLPDYRALNYRDIKSIQSIPFKEAASTNEGAAYSELKAPAAATSSVKPKI